MRNRVNAGVCCAMVLIGMAAGIARAGERETTDALPTTANTTEATNFPKGLFVMSLTGGYYSDVSAPHEDVNPYTLGFSYYVRDRLGLGVEVSGLKLDAKDGFDDAGAAGLNLTLRHHIFERGDFSLYLDAVLGMIYADDEFPPGGTRFNYTEHAGVGMSYRLRDDLFLIGGAKFMHISNAYIHGADQNPGVNAVGGYIGVLFKF